MPPTNPVTNFPVPPSLYAHRPSHASWFTPSWLVAQSNRQWRPARVWCLFQAPAARPKRLATLRPLPAIGCGVRCLNPVSRYRRRVSSRSRPQRAIFYFSHSQEYNDESGSKSLASESPLAGPAERTSGCINTNRATCGPAGYKHSPRCETDQSLSLWIPQVPEVILPRTGISGCTTNDVCKSAQWFLAGDAPFGKPGIEKLCPLSAPDQSIRASPDGGIRHG